MTALNHRSISFIVCLLFLIPTLVNSQRFVNVAEGKQCHMSSQAPSSTCSSAVDGNVETGDEAQCALTAVGDFEPLWSVDLGQIYFISQIVIFGREAVLSRMANVVVTVDDTEVYKFPRNIPSTQVRTGISSLPLPLYGQMVTITRNSLFPNDYSLAFCELQVLVCEDTSFGSHCDENCSSNCNLAQVRLCHPSNGTCIRGCQDGWYGNTCDQACSSNCAPPLSPSNGRRCDEVSGYCLKGCVSGWRGVKCSEPCNSTCKGRCDIHTGDCSECIIGRYGDSCGLHCRSNCQNGCERSTGYCNSCVGNFVLPHCTDCMPGFHGTNCTELCGNCYGNGTCSQVDGRCASDCKEGFAGSNCTGDLNPDQNKNENQTWNLAGSVLGAGFMIAIGIILSVTLCYGQGKRT